MTVQKRITDDLDLLLAVLPPEIAEAVRQADDSDNLLEIILDLGRYPSARFVEREVVLREREVTHEELDYVVQRIGDFDADNRAGIERTLHRIAAIRNRRGTVIGLTCRVGRAVYGTIDILEDIITANKSVLLLGRPGVGKTTLLREAARILAESRRVVIVDTSNEIGGDGDVPHPAVGKARRMQVREPMLQHEVMIEAVENHNPEVIVIDEIGRELEALAARTIAERGVQLIATAHGHTLDNLLLNPTLSDLVGGIQAVTLSDEEARRRGTQKTVLERQAPPTFDVLVEIQHRDRLAVHMDLAEAVDSILRGYPIPPEIRVRDADGQIRIERPQPTAESGRRPGSSGRLPLQRRREPGLSSDKHEDVIPEAAYRDLPNAPADVPARKEVAIFPYGVARNRLEQAIKYMRVPARLVNNLGDADVLVTLRSYYRKRQRMITDAERRGMPIYILRANSVSQIQRFLGDYFDMPAVQGRRDYEDIRAQTLAAIQAVLNGERWVDLPPMPSEVRRMQHELARQYNLVSHSYGKEPRRHVRIFRE